MKGTRQAHIRRIQDTLIIAGDGVIAFGAWTLVKTALFFSFVNGEQLMQELGLDGFPPASLYAVAGVILAIELSVRAYVGFSARSEGRGKKKGPFYLIVAVLAALVNMYAAVSTMLGMSITLSNLDLVVSVIVELTAFLALAAVLYCSLCLRHLNKAEG